MSYTQEPVKFNDEPPEYASTHVGAGPSRKGATTITTGLTSLPGLSRTVSGVTADPFDERNENGRTDAESIVHHYRRSTTSPSNDADSDVHYRPHDDDDRASSVYPYPASTTEAMTYVDENFQSYSNRRRPPPAETPKEELEEPYAASNDRNMSRSFQDLGEPYLHLRRALDARVSNVPSQSTLIRTLHLSQRSRRSSPDLAVSFGMRGAILWIKRLRQSDGDLSSGRRVRTFAGF